MAVKKCNKADSYKNKILIVDDHPIVRYGLESLINNETDMEVCGQVENSHEVTGAIKKLNPEIVTVDISLKEKNGLELIKDIRICFSKIPILCLSMHDEFLYAERVLRAGAQGYIMKQQAADYIILAIRRVLKGQVYISEKMTAKMMNKIVRGKAKENSCVMDCLSDRELEVFLLIGKGYATRLISNKMCLSIKTVESYRSHIKEKLNLGNASELLQFAIQSANTQII